MKTKNSQSAEAVEPAAGSEQAAGKIRWSVGMIRGQALIIVLLFLVLCTFIAIAFLTNVTSSGVGENASASENRASQLATTAVQLVEGTITNATVSGTYPTVAWACQPGMIRTYGKGGLAGASSAPLAYYKLYSSGTMVVTNTMDMNPNDIFSADVPPTWDKMPSYYTDLNAPLFVTNPATTNPATSGTTEVFPIADPRAADADISVAGFNFSNLMPGSSGGTIDGIVTSGTTGLYANDTTSRLPMPVAWIYVLKDGTLTVPTPPSNGVSLSGTTSWSNATNPPTPTNPIVGRVAFWTDDESGKINVNTASEGTYWDTPVANSGSSTQIFTTGTTPISDYTMALIQPAQHEYQRYAGHPATTCLSTVFGNALANSGLMRADIVKAITDAVPRVSDYGQGATTNYSPPAGSLATTMGGTVPVTGSTSVITDEDRLYTNLDEFQFQPNRTLQNLNILMSGSAAQEEQNDVDTCRFFLTAHSKAPELNMFGLPRVSIWPIWDSSHASNRTAFENEILRCSTLNASGTNPHQMCFFRYDPTSTTNDYTGATVARNPVVYGYLQSLLKSSIPGYGLPFCNSNNSYKYGQSDTNQILTEIFDYIRCTNLADNSAGASPYTSATGTGVNQAGLGQVVPIQIVPPGTSGTTHGIGRIATISELGLELIKVDDRANTAMAESTTNLSSTITVTGAPGISKVNPQTQTLIEWSLIPMLADPMPGWVGQANNLRIKFTNINLSIGGVAISAATTGTISDVYSTGQMGGGRDSRVGGLIGPTALLISPSPSDSMYPTGLIVINGTSVGSAINPLPGGAAAISGNVGVTISGTAGTSGASGPTLQTFTFVFPPMPAPIPRLQIGTYIGGGTATTWWGTFRAPNNAYTTGSTGTIVTGTFTYPTAPSNRANSIRINGSGYQLAQDSNDVLRTLVTTGTLNGANVAGDLRLIAVSGSIPATTFQPSAEGVTGLPPTPVPVTGTNFVEGNIRWGKGVVAVKPVGAGTLVPTIAESAYVSTFYSYAPAVPAEALGPNGPGAGDWDNGPGMMVDGPWANKPDEGMYAGAGGSAGNTPYIGDYDIVENTTLQLTTLFSPNRQISSPVMFGSLPVGADHPWQTLLFRPASLPGYHGGYIHPGNASPGSVLPDHLLLDLFWMPVVEPYGISEPLATSGKINLNFQIAPFAYINRQTGLDAVLKSVMITALNPTAGPGQKFSQLYKAALTDNSGTTSPTVSTRFPIDPVQTLNQLITTSTSNYPVFTRSAHSLAAPNFFVSPTQICDVPLIPMGYTGGDSGNLSSFWSANSLTGDNSLERPYSLIYPRVTTKSNIFTVHVIAQALKQAPGDLVNGTWTENVDQVTGEVRGAYTIEKYYDPNADDLSYYASARSGLVALSSSSDGTITSNPTIALRGAKWRLLNVKRFGQ